MGKKYLMKGNEALAEAAIRAGCRHFFGYPITPQTEVAAYMAKQMPKLGGTYLQAESEVAAINMVLGAASAGVRAMTSSSSPGISLKQEGISYLAASDLPALIVNVMRGSPGLGGIQPSQADYWQATKAPGHGDAQILVFAPSSVQEIVNLVGHAFHLAEVYRMPAMLLADGLLGQMMEPVEFPEETPAPSEKPWALTGTGGKRPPNIVNSLYLTPSQLEEIVQQRFLRYQQVQEKEVMLEQYHTDDARYLMVAYGATARIVKSAVDKARAEGILVGLIRPITLWPFPTAEIAAAAEQAEAFLCVEMSMGQMVEDVRLAVNGRRPVEFYGRTGGMVPTPAEILNEIRRMARKEG